jgi:signal transduction histidine kinase
VSDAKSNVIKRVRRSSVLPITLGCGSALLWLLVAILQYQSALELRAATGIRLGKEVANGVFYRQVILHGFALLLLGGCFTLLVLLAYRAQKLAKAQMELVASVSHELRTPLSAIFSAGENIRDGYVEGHKDLKFYGTILTSQARRLIDLVDRILLFASTSAGTKRYSIARLAVPEILVAVRKNVKEGLAEEGYTLEEHIDSDLPEAFGDLSAVSMCLQNLIGNAVKYGGTDHWIGLSVTRQHTTDHRLEIQFRVQDHGRGIRASDLQRIFEPFYRTPDVVAAQIHGTGLGLALSKRIAESLGGRISVTSEPGVGSTFALHLRAAPARQLLDRPISTSTGQ